MQTSIAKRCPATGRSDRSCSPGGRRSTRPGSWTTILPLPGRARSLSSSGSSRVGGVASPVVDRRAPRRRSNSDARAASARGVLAAAVHAEALRLAEAHRRAGLVGTRVLHPGGPGSAQRRRRRKEGISQGLGGTPRLFAATVRSTSETVCRRSRVARLRHGQLTAAARSPCPITVPAGSRSSKALPKGRRRE